MNFKILYKNLLLFMYKVEKTAVMRKITYNAKVRWFVNDRHKHDEIGMAVLVQDSDFVVEFFP